jgi:hypothetical protein
MEEDDIEEQIARVKGDLPSYDLIQEHFVEPFSAEVDEFTGKTVDIFDKFNQPEQFDGGTQGGTSESESDTEPQSEPDTGYTPPLENYAPRRDEGFTLRPLPEDEGLNLETYTDYVVNEAARSFQHSLEQRRALEMDERVLTSEATAKKIYGDYDAVVDGWTVPAIRADPRIFQWLRTLPNPARTAYELGQQLRDRHTAQTFRPTVRGRNSRGSQRTGRLTKEWIDSASVEEFTRELEAFKNS